MSIKKNVRSLSRRANRGETGLRMDGKLGLETLEGRQLLAADVLGATSVAPPSGWAMPTSYEAYRNAIPQPAPVGVPEVAPIQISVEPPATPSSMPLFDYATTASGTLTKKDPTIFLGG